VLTARIEITGLLLIFGERHLRGPSPGTPTGTAGLRMPVIGMPVRRSGVAITFSNCAWFGASSQVSVAVAQLVSGMAELRA
jgi:hypothetical protein